MKKELKNTSYFFQGSVYMFTGEILMQLIEQAPSHTTGWFDWERRYTLLYFN